LAAIRLPICGFIQIDTSGAISTSILANFLNISITHLKRALPFSDLSAVPYERRFFHRYYPVFLNMSPCMVNRFKFLIPTPAIPTLGTEPDLGQRYKDLQMKLARTFCKLTQLKEERARPAAG
jgi:hypothetical protein